MYRHSRNHEGHADTMPPFFVSDGGASSAIRRTSAPNRTLDQTLEQCLLDTQRQVCRLEAIVQRLGAVSKESSFAPAGGLRIESAACDWM